MLRRSELHGGLQLMGLARYYSSTALRMLYFLYFINSKFPSKCCRRYNFEPKRGFEPPTYCLQNSCSTIELLRHKKAGGPMISFFFWQSPLILASSFHRPDFSAGLFLLIFEVNLKFYYLSLRLEF